MSERGNVIDLSHHNEVDSFEAIRGDGILAVILKATEGTSYTDDQYADRRALALAAGLALSSYHFLRHTDVQLQMDHFLGVVAPVRGERVCIDHEADATLDDLIGAVRALRRADPFLEITVYSGHLIKEQTQGLEPFVQTRTSLWVAQYEVASPSWPQNIWPVWSLWQYTQEGRVDGVNGPVDLNHFNGSDEQLLAWFGPAGREAA